MQTWNENNNPNVFNIKIWWNTIARRLHCIEHTVLFTLSASQFNIHQFGTTEFIQISAIFLTQYESLRPLQKHMAAVFQWNFLDAGE